MSPCEARRQHAVRRTASRCAEDGLTVAGKEGSASGRRWRVSAEPDARPRVARGRKSTSGARAAAARSAAPPARHTPSVGRDTEQKGGRSLAEAKDRPWRTGQRRLMRRRS